MRYYVAKGPIPELGYDWEVSFYKMKPNGETNVIRIKDNIITTTSLLNFNSVYISKYCKEVTKEEYESMLEL